MNLSQQELAEQLKAIGFEPDAIAEAMPEAFELAAE
jgi:hypothetical protein